MMLRITSQKSECRSQNPSFALCILHFELCILHSPTEREAL